jgi:transcription elongation factor GreA
MRNMESEEVLLLTRDGLRKFENELNYLRTVKRREMAENIKEALTYGDIADNPEYEDAKNAQAFVEGRIIVLEKILRRARVLEKNGDNGHHVELGSKVKLKDLITNEEYEYTIVSSAEADPFEMKISNESPVGRAVIGNTIGAQVNVKAPVGNFNYRIEAVS